MSPIGKLMKEVLQRPAKQRAAMARELIASLGPSGPQLTKREWDREIQSRVQQIESGHAKMIPWGQVKSHIEKAIRQQCAR